MKTLVAWKLTLDFEVIRCVTQNALCYVFEIHFVEK